MRGRPLGPILGVYCLRLGGCPPAAGSFLARGLRGRFGLAVGFCGLLLIASWLPPPRKFLSKPDVDEGEPRGPKPRPPSRPPMMSPLSSPLFPLLLAAVIAEIALLTELVTSSSESSSREERGRWGCCCGWWCWLWLCECGCSVGAKGAFLRAGPAIPLPQGEAPE